MNIQSIIVNFIGETSDYTLEVMSDNGEMRSLTPSQDSDSYILSLRDLLKTQRTVQETIIEEKERQNNFYFQTIANRIPGIFTPEEIAEKIDAFPRWSGDGTVHSPGQHYQHNGILWKVISANEFSTQQDWEPGVAHSLYTEVLPPDVIGLWVQPIGAHDAYPIGKEVQWENKIWRSKINANDTKPGEDPDNRWWELVRELEPVEEEPADPVEPEPEEPTEPTIDPWEDRWSIDQTGYITGDVVTHNGFYWTSKIGAPGNWNIHEPSDDTYAAWEKGDPVI